jgi:glycosyltransferase involved in cell wall biosynthesis
VKIILFANTDWYLYNFRLALAQMLHEQGHEVVMVSPPGEYVSRLEEAGFRWISFSLARRGINPFNEWGTIHRLESLYRQEKPDIVHHFTIKCVLYGSIAARRTGISAVVNAITGLGYVFVNQDLEARLLRPLIKSFYRYALKGTQVIFENPDDQKMFLEMGLLKPDQVNLILGTGVDTGQFVPLGEPDNIPLVAMPSRMLWDKGVGDFVEAGAILRKSGMNARFALVGAGDPQNPSGISMEQLGVWQKEGNVEWWGWQEDIGAVFALAHIICLPSYREGIPRVLVEAAACARPIITTDVPGCREVVLEGVNGLLIPPHDPLRLAEALKKLIENPNMRHEMGLRGRERVLELFSDDKVIGKTIDVYHKALQIGSKG